MEAVELSALLGTTVGSLIGSYFVATRASKPKKTGGASNPPPVQPDATVAKEVAALATRLDALEKEVRSEVRSLDARVATLAAEVLTLDEFQAYVTMDSERRERLIAKIGELQGSLAALLPHMRK